MNTSSTYPFAANWTAQDLADAVPLRLFELFSFDVEVDGADIARVANQAPRRGLRGAYLSGTYLRINSLPAFIRVHC